MTTLLALLLTTASASEADRDPIAARLWERTSDFLTEGTGPGDAIPAGERKDDLGWMKWADASIGLGWWLVALAAEHRLRVDADLDTADIDRRLYEALTASERIDRVAETGFPEPCESYEALNGFFVRDDVPVDHGARFDGIGIVESDWIDPSVQNKEMSQDQVHHLAAGLLAVETLVPDAVEVDGKALAPWAAEQGARILERMDAAGWVITNPACGDEDVKRGSIAVHASPGFAGVYAALTDGGTLTRPYDGELAWATLAQPENPAYLNPDNLHMTLVTAAAGHGYGDDTFAIVDALAQRDDWLAYPLLHVVIHGESEAWRERREDLLTDADAMLVALGDDEPLGPPEGVIAPPGWTSWHRFIRPAEQHGPGAANREGRRFAGIDWLALDGLARLAAHAGDVDTALPDDDDRDDAGCGCTTTPGTPPALLAVVAAALLGRRRATRARPAADPAAHA